VALSWTVLRGGGEGRGEAGDRPLWSPSCSLDLLCKDYETGTKQVILSFHIVIKEFITSGMGGSKLEILLSILLSKEITKQRRQIKYCDLSPSEKFEPEIND
jgi:hypothetical protein